MDVLSLKERNNLNSIEYFNISRYFQCMYCEVE
jgi:hypothetical protein